MPMTARRRDKCERLCSDAVEHYDRIESTGPTPEYVMDDGRASGLALCPHCGNEYYDHPTHPFADCLTIACNGQLLKL